jgi:predicted GNAT family N-acyltransferase
MDVNSVIKIHNEHETANFRVAPYSAAYDNQIAEFDCGEEKINDYLKNTARESNKNNFSRLHLAFVDNTLVGYYTLSNYSIKNHGVTDAPTTLPCLLIGRLGVDLKFQGQRYGERLVLDAILKCKKINQYTAAYYIIVHSKNNSISPFYQKYRFNSIQPSNEKALGFNIGEYLII